MKAHKQRQCNRPRCNRVPLWLYTTKQWEICNECAGDLRLGLAELEPLNSSPQPRRGEEPKESQSPHPTPQEEGEHEEE